MKKILRILILSLFFFSNVNAEERNNKLDKLFVELKNTKNLSSAHAIEKEINQLLNHINGFKKDEKLKDTIHRGLEIIA